MSFDKSKADRLADRLDFWARAGFCDKEAAAELRRLSAIETELLDALRVAVVALAGAAVDRPEFFKPYKVVSDAITKQQEARNG